MNQSLKNSNRTSKNSVSVLLQLGAKILGNSSDALCDLRVILEHTLRTTYAELLSNPNKVVLEAEAQNFLDLVLKRKNKIPTAYLIGEQEFYGLTFLVNKHTLIPRQDSECLIDHMLEVYRAKKDQKIRILDLGTGSGCLIITMLKLFPKAQSLAIDISKQALKIAEQNAQRLGVADRVTFAQSNWFTNIVEQKFDLIISNPPYIGFEEAILLQSELLHEPKEALFSENNGFASYEHIADKASRYLADGAHLFVESGYKSQAQVIQILEKKLKFLGSKLDLKGYARSLCFSLQN